MAAEAAWLSKGFALDISGAVNGGYSPEMVNRGLRGSPVDIEMVGGIAESPLQDVTLHRVSRRLSLGRLMVK